MNDKTLTFCPVYRSINLLQEKWTLHIVRSLLDEPKGFNELGRDIGGCNPTTLTQRLERLEHCGIVAKQVQSTMPPRTRYSLTPAGRALDDVIRAVQLWGVAYLQEDGTCVESTEEVVAAAVSERY